MDIDWADPTSRFFAIGRLGVEEYNRRFQKFLMESRVAVVNGYPIRRVQSHRFGLLYQIDKLDVAFPTLADAAKHANAISIRGPERE